ncbi:MAG: hypothetical protein ACYDDI_17540 [Candidatus Acidiferrales bacterium]
MKKTLFMLALFAVAVPLQAQAAPGKTKQGCIAVKPAGSHAFRNIMLLGVAGAMISKAQYQVLDVQNYPAKIGQKFHGNDLQTIQNGGTRVLILDKKQKPDGQCSAGDQTDKPASVNEKKPAGR